MPTLTTEGGKPVEVTGQAEAINDAFRSVMDADDGPAEQAPPKRPEKPAADGKPKRGRPRAEDKSRTTAKASSSLSDADRAAGVQGLAQLGSALVLMAGKATGNTAYLADAATIAANAPAIADACVQVAKNDARFAAALDKVCSSGPYAALIGVGVSVGVQCLRNHRPGLALPGTVHPDELLGSAGGASVPAAA